MASILDGLTASQREVLRLLALGLTDSEIAEERGGCSSQTIKFHVSGLLARLGARNRTDAAVRYVREVDGTTPAPVVTRIVHRPIEVAAPPCPACAIRQLAVTARNAGLHVTAISDRGVRVATPRVPTGILLHDEQDLTDLCTELAEAA